MSVCVNEMLYSHSDHTCKYVTNLDKILFSFFFIPSFSPWVYSVYTYQCDITISCTFLWLAMTQFSQSTKVKIFLFFFFNGYRPFICVANILFVFITVYVNCLLPNELLEFKNKKIAELNLLSILLSYVQVLNCCATPIILF